MTATAASSSIPAPVDGAPEWLRLFMLAAGRLPLASVADGFSPRAVVAAPTTRHLPVAFAASAVVPPTPQWSSPIAPDQRVATVLSKKFQDVSVAQGVGTRLNLSGTQLDPSRTPLPPAATLPDEWDIERQPRPLPDVAVEKLKQGFSPPQGERLPVGEWLYQQMCLEPIVILTQRPGRVVDDASELCSAEDWWNSTQSIALLDLVEGAEWWFRRPIIVVSPQALSALPWADQLPVRLVVVVGFSTWMSPARQRWNAAPQVLMLNQRSTDVSDFRQWFDGTSFGEFTLPGLRNTKKYGLTLTAFGEPNSLTSATDEDDWDL